MLAPILSNAQQRFRRKSLLHERFKPSSLDHVISNIASTSTAGPVGNDAKPKALRAW